MIKTVVLRLPVELADKLKSVAPRGHRSDFIINLLNEHLNKIHLENKNYMPELSKKRYVSVKHIPKIYPAFNEGGIRHLIFNHKKTKFTKCFTHIGMGKKIVIDLDEFEKWIQKKE